MQTREEAWERVTQIVPTAQLKGLHEPLEPPLLPPIPKDIGKFWVFRTTDGVFLVDENGTLRGFGRARWNRVRPYGENRWLPMRH